ncbi:MAG: type II secretion system F family protein [bacterium]
MKNLISKIIPVSLTEKMLFTKNLAVMVKSGISLPRSLNILSNQVKHFYFKNAIIQVQNSVQKGETLANALGKHNNFFNQFYINMIKIGETSGSLERVLGVLAKQIKRDHELITKIKSAMIYPALILTTLIGIGIAMLIFVVPKLSMLFADMQMQLPLTTRLILSFADNTKTYGVFILASILILSIVFYFYRRGHAGKKTLDKLLLYLPFLGKISQKVNTARLASNLSSLLESGVSLVDSLETLKGVLSNLVYSLSLEDVSQKVQKGKDLSKALSLYPKLYSPLLLQMIEIGEETGTVSNSLEQVAEFYQNEIDETLKNISSIIEPVLMIIIGGIVGFFALSMILPIYSMIQNI